MVAVVHLLLVRCMLCVGCVRGISHQIVALQSESLSKEFCFQGVSWHKHKLWLAFIAGPDRVFVHDFGDTGNQPLFWVFLMHFYSLVGEVPVDILAECICTQLFRESCSHKGRCCFHSGEDKSRDRCSLGIGELSAGRWQCACHCLVVESLWQISFFNVLLLTN
jgi:hypothetical protein